MTIAVTTLEKAEQEILHHEDKKQQQSEDFQIEFPTLENAEREKEQVEGEIGEEQKVVEDQTHEVHELTSVYNTAQQTLNAHLRKLGERGEKAKPKAYTDAAAAIEQMVAALAQKHEKEHFALKSGCFSELRWVLQQQAREQAQAATAGSGAWGSSLGGLMSFASGAKTDPYEEAYKEHC